MTPYKKKEIRPKENNIISLLKEIHKQRILFIMALPFLAHALIFSYIPIWGWTRAFFDIRGGSKVFESEYIGLKFFYELFGSPSFYLALRNTLVISIMNLFIGMLASVILAVLLNEVRNIVFKRTIQTISYLPHFVSWAIVAGIFNGILSIDNGLINQLLLKLGIIETAIPFLLRGEWFWALITSMNVWKSVGWGAIIYIAAISTINPELYDAALADGAGRIRRIWHITLPGIKNTIVILLVLQMGWLLGTGFEQSLLMGNGANMQYSDVLATYILRYGIQMGRFSFATAAGIFQSLIGIIMVVFANLVAKKFSDNQIF